MISIQYRTLCSLRVVHGYYAGPCACFEPVITAEAARDAGRARLLYKQLNGALHVLYEADTLGAPRVVATGLRLRIGLKLVEPAFNNITEPLPALAAGFAKYDNQANANALGAPEAATLVGNVLVHSLQQAARPLTVRLRDASGVTLVEERVGASPDVSFALDDYHTGSLTVDEDDGAGAVTSAAYYRQPELQAIGVLAAVDIDVDASFYATPPSFEIAFQARVQPLNYYLVVDNYSDTDFDALRVSDADATRAIGFTRIAASAFGTGELPVDLLASGATRVVLFRSTNALPRQQPARRKLQLSRNGDVLIEHLPQPREDRPDTDLIIHLSK